MNIDKDIKEFIQTFTPPVKELEIFSKEELEILFQYQRNQFEEFKNFINPLPFVVNFETALDFSKTNEGREYWINKFNNIPASIENISSLENLTKQKEDIIDIINKKENSILFSIDTTFYCFDLENKKASKYTTIEDAQNNMNATPVEDEDFKNILEKVFSSSSIIKMNEFSKNDENPSISSINILINKEINNLLKHNINTPEPKENENIYRQIYDDNLFDIHSIKDFNLNQLSFDILSKDSERISFEFGGDFWVYNRVDEMIIQYPDFVSMRDLSLNGKIVFNRNDESQSNEYGKILHQGLNNINLDEVENFNLENRTSYFLDNSIKGIEKKVDYSQGIKLQEEVENIGKKVLENLPKNNEIEPLKDIMYATISLLSMFLILSKRKRLEVEKEATIEKIIRSIENREIKFDDVLKNEQLLKQIPELKDILNQYTESNKFRIDNDDFKDLVEDIINNEYVVNIADNLSENDIFKMEMGGKIFEGIVDNFTEKYNKNIVQEISTAFSQSSFNDIDEFVSSHINANLSNFYQLNKSITGEQYALAGVFITSCINKEDKTTLAEIADFEKLTSKDFSNIGNILNTILSQTMKKEVKQGVKI